MMYVENTPAISFEEMRVREYPLKGSRLFAKEAPHRADGPDAVAELSRESKILAKTEKVMDRVKNLKQQIAQAKSIYSDIDVWADGLENAEYRYNLKDRGYGDLNSALTQKAPQKAQAVDFMV